MNEDEAILRELNQAGGGANRLPDGSYQAGFGTRTDTEQAVQICQLIARLSRVTSISFRLCAVTDQALAHLENVYGLKELKLRRTQVTGRGLWILPGMSQLEKLVLCDIKEHAREGMGFVGRVASLRELHMNGMPVTDLDLAGLQSLKNLETVDLGRTPVNRGLSALSSCQQLRWLNLGRSSVGDDGMPAVIELTSLEELCLADTRITDRGLEGIPSLQRLKWLALSGTAATWKGLEKVAEIGGLEVLFFDDNRVTRRECSVLAQMDRLNRLHLREGFVGISHLLYLRWKLPDCKFRIMPRRKRERQHHAHGDLPDEQLEAGIK